MKYLKSLMAIFVVVSMVLCFSLTAFAWTFDSEIDPREFLNWERTNTTQTSPYGGIVTLRNPDHNAKIKEAMVSIWKNNLISYWYIIDGKTYKYEFNDVTKNYDLVVPETATEKQN